MRYAGRPRSHGTRGGFQKPLRKIAFRFSADVFVKACDID